MFADILKNNNYTIKSFSDECGVPKSTIADLYHGKTSLDKMSLRNARLISQCLGITMDELYDYCHLTEYDDPDMFDRAETQKVIDYGIVSYWNNIEQSNLLEVSHRLNDSMRFNKYCEVLGNLIKYRKWPCPEKYKKYMEAEQDVDSCEE